MAFVHQAKQKRVQNRAPWAETSLTTDRGCIRILQLHHGLKGTPITCELRVAYLDDDPYFEALSYVWGDPSDTRPIQVNGASFDATVNLYDFLQCLRKETTDRYLWADAICIDQSNQEEKDYQIGLMTKIYRNAKETHIWFGPFCADTFTKDTWYSKGYVSTTDMAPEDWLTIDRVFIRDSKYFTNQTGFRALTEKEHREFRDACRDDVLAHTLSFLEQITRTKQHLYTYPVYILETQHDGRKVYRANRSWLEVLDCMRWLLTRPWWTRVWTLQEAVLPRVDPLVHAPPTSFRLSQLVDGVDQMVHHVGSSCCKWFGRPVFTPFRDHSHIDPYGRAQILYAQRASLKNADSGFIPLDKVIDAVQGRTATEVRDHWFGILGFMPPVWQEADRRTHAETWTTAEIFSKCSKLLYSETSDLTHIGRAIGQECSDIVTLPTWAIDLSTDLAANKDFNRWKLYNASRGVSHKGVRLWKDTKTLYLTVQAMHLGSVSACGESIHPDALDHREAHEIVRKLLIQWHELYSDKVPDAKDDNAFWRTIFMDTNVWIHYLAPRRGTLHAKRVKDIKQWWHNWNATKDCHDLSFDLKSGGEERGFFHYRAVDRNLTTTKFFVTTKGIPGMGPHDMQPADEVYALAGCRALAVLRKAEGQGNGRWTFVGLCFLDGWMHGRATQSKNVWETIRLY